VFVQLTVWASLLVVVAISYGVPQKDSVTGALYGFPWFNSQEWRSAKICYFMHFVIAAIMQLST